MENTTKDFSHINGWGIDADPKNDPTYPMKHRTDEEQRGYTWERPAQQPIDIEVLQSIERPNVSAVFGTASPPSGLSGMIRRFAFQYSESSYGHWLPLLLADRVSVVEGVLDDLAHGHVPNIFAEKGYKAQWKHNPGSLITQAAVGGVLAVALIAWLSPKRSGSQKDKRPKFSARYRSGQFKPAM